MRSNNEVESNRGRLGLQELLGFLAGISITLALARLSLMREGIVAGIAGLLSFPCFAITIVWFGSKFAAKSFDYRTAIVMVLCSIATLAYFAAFALVYLYFKVGVERLLAL